MHNVQDKWNQLLLCTGVLAVSAYKGRGKWDWSIRCLRLNKQKINMGLSQWGVQGCPSHRSIWRVTDMVIWCGHWWWQCDAHSAVAWDQLPRSFSQNLHPTNLWLSKNPLWVIRVLSSDTQDYNSMSEISEQIINVSWNLSISCNKTALLIHRTSIKRVISSLLYRSVFDKTLINSPVPAYRVSGINQDSCHEMNTSNALVDTFGCPFDAAQC